MRDKVLQNVVAMGGSAIIFGILLNPFTVNFQQSLCGGIILGIFWIGIVDKNKN